MAFFKHGFDAARDKPFLSFCHETGSGWTFDDDRRLPGCRRIKGRRVQQASSDSRAALPSSLMAPHAATFESSDGKTGWRRVGSIGNKPYPQPTQGSIVTALDLEGRQAAARGIPALEALLQQQQRVKRNKATAPLPKGGEIGSFQDSQTQVSGRGCWCEGGMGKWKEGGARAFGASGPILVFALFPAWQQSAERLDHAPEDQ